MDLLKEDLMFGFDLLLIQGGKKGVLRALKRFSLSTCTASLLGSPLLVLLGSQDVPVVGRSAIAFTGELNWFHSERPGEF